MSDYDSITTVNTRYLTTCNTTVNSRYLTTGNTTVNTRYLTTGDTTVNTRYLLHRNTSFGTSKCGIIINGKWNSSFGQFYVLTLS